MSLYPWQHDEWTGLVRRHQTQGLPHALMISGAAGIGKHELCLEIAQWLLCQNPSDNACGQCHSCQLWRAGSHPDFMLAQPEDGSRQIRIETVRKVNNMIFQTPQISRCQVVILRPVDVMNANAANALLKTLEEPPGESFLLLETERFGSVLPTIRSRCQRITLTAPSAHAALDWLHKQNISDIDAKRALQRNGGAPVKAKAWLETGVSETQERWVELLLQWTKGIAPLDTVSSAWGKLEFADVIEWYYHLSCDLMKASSGVPLEYYVFAEPVAEINACVVVDKEKLITFQAKLQRILGQLLSGVSHHNKSLTLEVLLLEWLDLAPIEMGASQ